MSATMLQVAEGLLALPGARHLPHTNKNPVSNLPTLPEAQVSDSSIPIIDLEALHGPRRSDIVKQLGQACQHKGFFAVKNHGIPRTTVSNIFDTTREFFHLPKEERMKFYTPDPNSDIRLMNAYKDEVANVFVARESLKFHCHPVENYVNKWPTNPPSFRKYAAEYLTYVRRVEITLLGAISESLGLERDYIEKKLGGHYVSLNYYGACEKSDLELTYGVRAHTDPTIITILSQDDVPGLQVLSEGEWMDVNPIPGTVVVHVGDLLQVKNHGIPRTTVSNIFDTTREFFHLPKEERMKFYTPDPNSDIRLMNAYKDEVANVFVARESLKFHCHPVENYVNKWPTNPPSFRKYAAEYLTNVRRVEITLLGAISESLGLERDYIEKKLGGHYVSLNYYGACEQSDLELTYGVRAHTDPTIITILSQDDVPGLQVLSEGEWMDVNPIPGTVVVHVGDLLQAISNHKFKSLLHQAMVNCEKERMSIASYCYPSSDAMIGPPKKLIDNDHPAVYKDFTFKEFSEQMWKVITFTDTRLDSFKCSTA